MEVAKREEQVFVFLKIQTRSIYVFPEMELLIPVMKSAAELVHSVFRKELKLNWEHSIQNLSKQYCLMRNTIEERAMSFAIRREAC